MLKRFKRKHGRRLLRLAAFGLAALLSLTPLAAVAETYNIENGSIEVTADENGRKVTQGGSTNTETSETVITGSSTVNTVTITVAQGAEASVTLSGLSIDVSDAEKAALTVGGAGDLTVELDGSNTLTSGEDHAGLEKNSTGELIIADENETSGSLTATGGDMGAGIGGGYKGEGSSVTVSGDSQVKAVQGAGYSDFGSGAAIGSGGRRDDEGNPVAGTDIEPNVSELGPDGVIYFYVADATEPYRVIRGKANPGQAAPLYRVLDKAGTDMAYEEQISGGVLTVTARADYARFSAQIWGLKALQEQGIREIRFVTDKASSAFSLSSLLNRAAGGETVALTHDGETVTFFLGAADVSDLLK